MYGLERLCPGRDSNPQAPKGAAPFKGAAFASFATRAHGWYPENAGFLNVIEKTKKGADRNSASVTVSLGKDSSLGG